MTRIVLSERQASALRACLTASGSSLVYRGGRYWTSFFGGRAIHARTIDALVWRCLLTRSGEKLVSLTDAGREAAISATRQARRDAARRQIIADSRLAVGSRIARERGARAPQRLPYRDD